MDQIRSETLPFKSRRIKIISLFKKISKKFFNLIGTPKIAKQDQKRAQKAPNGADLETKR